MQIRTDSIFNSSNNNNRWTDSSTPHWCHSCTCLAEWETNIISQHALWLLGSQGISWKEGGEPSLTGCTCPHTSAHAAPHLSLFYLPSWAYQCGLPWLTDNRRHKNPLTPTCPSQTPPSAKTLQPLFLSLRWNESLPCQGLAGWSTARRYPAIYCPFPPHKRGVW